MEKKSKINMEKQDNQEIQLPVKDILVSDLRAWDNDIKQICMQLAVPSDEFKKEETYNTIKDFMDKHKRWLYSTVSSFLFNCNEKDRNTFISNLDELRDYAYEQIDKSPQDSKVKEKKKKLAVAIDKLWDHSNLAHTQSQSFPESEETFNAIFDKNMIPFKAEFTHEMNAQFISLVAIFTALSFLVFGGISSLDNILSDVGRVPILELMIVGCIWSLCITNLVFVFIYFIAKLTKLNIKTSNEEGSTLSQRYPFYVWSNYILLLLLVVSCWLYYIDYANAGSWLLKLSKNYSTLTSIVGLVMIAVIFGALARFLMRKPTQKDKKSKKST